MIAEILRGLVVQHTFKMQETFATFTPKEPLQEPLVQNATSFFTVTGGAAEVYLTVNVMITTKNMEEMVAPVIYGGEQIQIVDIQKDALRTKEEFTTTPNKATPEIVKEIIIVFRKRSHTLEMITLQHMVFNRCLLCQRMIVCDMLLVLTCGEELIRGRTSHKDVLATPVQFITIETQQVVYVVNLMVIAHA